MWKCVLHECNSAGYYIPGKKPLFAYSEVFLGLYVLIMTLSPSFSVSAADPLLGFRDCFFVLMCTNNRSLIGHHDSIPLSFLHFPSKSKMPWRKEKKKKIIKRMGLITFQTLHFKLTSSPELPEAGFENMTAVSMLLLCP